MDVSWMCQLMFVDRPFGLYLVDVLPISAGLTRAPGVSSASAETSWSRGQAVWSLLRGHPESRREHVLVHGQRSRVLRAVAAHRPP